MTTVPHVTSGSGLRKFQANGFLLDRVYMRIYVRVNGASFMMLYCVENMLNRQEIRSNPYRSFQLQ